MCYIRKEAFSQSFRHISTFTIFGANKVLLSSIILSAVLKADSEDTVDTGIVKISRANIESTKNLTPCTLHHAKI